MVLTFNVKSHYVHSWGEEGVMFSIRDFLSLILKNKW